MKQTTTVPLAAAFDQRRSEDEQYFVASQWRLMWRKFRQHKLAMVGSVTILLLFFVGVLLPEFFSTQNPMERNSDFLYCPPQRIRFLDQGALQLRPFVYGLTRQRNPVTFGMEYGVDTTRKFPIRFFHRGDPYKLWGLFPADVHLIGIDEEPVFYLFGTDKLGRDLFSRVLYAARISLSVGFVGVLISFILGCILGGVSGFFGGKVDMLIQRIIEFLISLPTIPIWMGLAAAVPLEWPAVRVYFIITVILSIVGWAGLARVVRGKILSLREEDYVRAAVISGSGDMAVILRHLLPAFLSYLIVHLTLAIPGMILGETSLSFLGLGLRPPVISWGVLLNEAQNVKAIYTDVWLLIPGGFVMVTVLAFNFLGDGLRDAADPYR